MSHMAPIKLYLTKPVLGAKLIGCYYHDDEGNLWATVAIESAGTRRRANSRWHGVCSRTPPGLAR